RRPRASVEPGPAGAPSRRPRPAADPLSEPESLQVHRLLGAGGGRPRPRQLGRDGSREEARLETSFGDGSPGRCRRAPAAARWSGRILSGLAVAFLLFDAAVKLLELPVAVEGTTRLGYRESVVLPLGLVELACAIAYLAPRTSVLGAVLWTGYLGG